MKIAVIGSHGTGKTTICKQLSKLFKLNYIPDVVPDAYKLNFTINENTPPESQFWILTKQIELERNTPTPWIMEKSLWDNYIYASFSINDKHALKVIQKIIDANANYDLVFYCPIEFPLVDDSLRSLDKKFQKNIDKKFRKFLKTKKIKYHQLTGDKSQRLNQAKKILKKYL